MTDKNLEKLVAPFHDAILQEWASCRAFMGTDDLLVALDIESGRTSAFPRELMINHPEAIQNIPPDIMERIREPPGVREGCYRSFWVLFDLGTDMACIRISVATDSKHLPS